MDTGTCGPPPSGTSHSVNHHPGDYQTLGFMPLYPAAIWAVAHVTQIGNFGSGLLIAIVCGGIATVLIGQLAEQWWGEAAARRAIAFWCFFPGNDRVLDGLYGGADAQR